MDPFSYFKSDAIRLLPINKHTVTHPVSPNFPQRNSTSFNRRRRKEEQNLLHSSIFHQGRMVSFSFKKTGSICLSFFFFRSIRSFSSNRTIMDGFKRFSDNFLKSLQELQTPISAATDLLFTTLLNFFGIYQSF